MPEATYPCAALGDHMSVNEENYQNVPKDTTNSSVIYFMESEGAHEYWLHQGDNNGE